MRGVRVTGSAPAEFVKVLLASGLKSSIEIFITEISDGFRLSHHRRCTSGGCDAMDNARSAEWPDANRRDYDMETGGNIEDIVGKGTKGWGPFDRADVHRASLKLRLAVTQTQGPTAMGHGKRGTRRRK